MSSADTDISLLLRQWRSGDSQALDHLIPLVYERLRQLAHKRLRNEQDASLNTTALVHEAYLKLVQSTEIAPRDRSHFLALMSRLMRNLLVDHARARKAAKRGAGAALLELDEMAWISETDLETYSAVDEALKRLEELDSRQSRILENRYFGGLTLEETAESLGISVATVKRELRSGRAWLALELGREPS
ncbi:MAG TPA: ECF-type sigma factor [Gemmatimonadaceae bacterium]|nr:ECF-type sigma factor [Gemmatimonadaceae bacterium]